MKRLADMDIPQQYDTLLQYSILRTNKIGIPKY
jgi:hypothetical protein